MELSLIKFILSLVLAFIVGVFVANLISAILDTRVMTGVNKRKKETENLRKTWKCSYTEMSFEQNQKWLDVVYLNRYDWAAEIMKDFGVTFLNAIRKCMYCVAREHVKEAVSEVEQVYQRNMTKEEL